MSQLVRGLCWGLLVVASQSMLSHGLLGQAIFCQADEPETKSTKTLAELNAYWAEVSRSVGEGDFEGYTATCHTEGVLVSGVKQTSYPLTLALQRWKSGFDATRAKRMKASVQFRFSQRLHDDTTAHETGIFRYTSRGEGDEEVVQYVNFEGLLRKTATGWKIVMEYQKSMASEEDWNALSEPDSANE